LAVAALAVQLLKVAMEDLAVAVVVVVPVQAHNQEVSEFSQDCRDLAEHLDTDSAAATIQTLHLTAVQVAAVPVQLVELVVTVTLHPAVQAVLVQLLVLLLSMQVVAAAVAAVQAQYVAAQVEMVAEEMAGLLMVLTQRMWILTGSPDNLAPVVEVVVVPELILA
jgi:hypothetical protein